MAKIRTKVFGKKVEMTEEDHKRIEEFSKEQQRQMEKILEQFAHQLDEKIDEAVALRLDALINKKLEDRKNALEKD